METVYPADDKQSAGQAIKKLCQELMVAEKKSMTYADPFGRFIVVANLSGNNLRLQAAEEYGEAPFLSAVASVIRFQAEQHIATDFGERVIEIISLLEAAQAVKNGELSTAEVEIRNGKTRMFCENGAFVWEATDSNGGNYSGGRLPFGIFSKDKVLNDFVKLKMPTTLSKGGILSATCSTC